MNGVRTALATVLDVFFVLLIARLVFDWIQVFARQWTPRGVVLVVAEAVYTVTDPPIKAVRRVVPPLRLGGVGIDLAFLIVALAVQVAANLLR
ncbi:MULTISPECIES: YggT family protein [Dermacoccus]|uniref:Membrane protein n=1 Tax=Dermacoccus nishinomiyaensis TaxID=1274 RepID=A0A075JF93_9MICO|nr:MULTISPECIES: YggT family protein [Dermacoccus]AIF40559.1 membrane protein [Dermacoccus nishinomiyaensis]MBO1758053.1 YggT family protein [Dermacoccus sp. NHGro5]MCG7430157.1 YggT family protein [Dermacoccus nishinomiyaensis]MCI0154718.1 YggT family protein [Dermacoccus nishinomiyaensis]PZP02190.1 MAG: YggT family protein [Dermacoccus nishinomiyaensis]